jgi:hypothetical protein
MHWLRGLGGAAMAGSVQVGNAMHVLKKAVSVLSTNLRLDAGPSFATRRFYKSGLLLRYFGLCVDY